MRKINRALEILILEMFNRKETEVIVLLVLSSFHSFAARNQHRRVETDDSTTITQHALFVWTIISIDRGLHYDHDNLNMSNYLVGHLFEDYKPQPICFSCFKEQISLFILPILIEL